MRMLFCLFLVVSAVVFGVAMAATYAVGPAVACGTCG
jgi:hypothetical protein